MEKRNGFLSRRVALKSWQKLLLILACTALAGAAAYVYCEKIASPVYTSSVRAQLKVEDTETLMASGNAELTAVTLDILGGLREEGWQGKIIVTGCLAQRYGEELLREMPEIDGILGTGTQRHQRH